MLRGDWTSLYVGVFWLSPDPILSSEWVCVGRTVSPRSGFCKSWDWTKVQVYSHYTFITFLLIPWIHQFLILFSPGVIALGFLSWFGIIFLRMSSFSSRLDVDILLFSLVFCSPLFNMAAGGAWRWKWHLHGECCVTFSCRIQGSTDWLFVLSTKWIAAFNIMIPLGFLGLLGPGGWKDSRTDFSRSVSVEDNLSMSKGHLSKLHADDAVQTHNNYSTCNATTQQEKKSFFSTWRKTSD